MESNGADNRLGTQIETRKSATFRSTAREQIGERLFNVVVTRIPSHTVRRTWLRLFGAAVGAGTTVLMGTRVLGMHHLDIGDHCSIGSNCLLDARGGLTIDDAVVIGSEVQLISGQHVVNSDDFAAVYGPITVGHHVWIANRVTVVVGVSIGPGAVVGSASLVRGDVAPMAVVAGVPALVRRVRTSTLDYLPADRRRLT